MGWRFRRSIKIAPGIRWNIGLKSTSLSFGPRGAKLTVGSRGIRRTVSIPGTGLSYTETIDSQRRGSRPPTESATALPLPPSASRPIGSFAALCASNWTFGYTYGTTAGKRRSASIIEPADPERHLLSFVNVLELHIIDVMRWQHGLDVKKIRRAYQYMQDTLGQKRPFADVDLETDRVDVFARYLGKLVAVSRYGQVSLKELLEIHLNRIERDTSGLGVRLFPFVQKKRPEPERLRSVPRMIAMDPRIAFGRPVITGSRIATFEIAERYKAGDSIANLATDYDRPSEEIEEAIRIELTLEPAA